MLSHALNKTHSQTLTLIQIQTLEPDPEPDQDPELDPQLDTNPDTKTDRDPKRPKLSVAIHNHLPCLFSGALCCSGLTKQHVSPGATVVVAPIN